VVDRERVHLTAAAVQGHHELTVLSLAVRMLCDQLVELGDHLAVPGECQVGIDARFLGIEPQLLEPPDLVLRE
jgi:hypothetical protein